MTITFTPGDVAIPTLVVEMSGLCMKIHTLDGIVNAIFHPGAKEWFVQGHLIRGFTSFAVCP